MGNIILRKSEDFRKIWVEKGKPRLFFRFKAVLPDSRKNEFYGTIYLFFVDGCWIYSIPVDFGKFTYDSELEFQEIKENILKGTLRLLSIDVPYREVMEASVDL